MTHLPKHLAPHEHVTPAMMNAVFAELRRLNNIAAAPPVRVSRNAAGIEIGLARELPQFDLVELSDTIAAGEQDKTSKQLCYRPADDPPALFGVGPDEHDLQRTADGQQGLYLAGERHLAYFHPSAGQRILLPGVLFHLGKLTEAISPPDADTPDVLTSGSVDVWRYNADSGEYEAALDGGGEQITVDAYDWTHAGLAPGWVYLFQHNQSRNWFVIPLPAAIYNTATITDSSQTLNGTDAIVQLHSDGDLTPLVTFDNATYKFTLADDAPEGIYEIFFCLSLNDGQGGTANTNPSDITLAPPTSGNVFDCSYVDLQHFAAQVNARLSAIRSKFDAIGDNGYLTGSIYAAGSAVQTQRAFATVPVAGPYTSGGLACHALVSLSPGDEVYAMASVGDSDGGSPTFDVEFARLSIDYLGPAAAT